MGEAGETIHLKPWTGPWPDDDPDANFKADIALHAVVDPLATIRRLSEGTGVPVGALVHYVLARWASEASAGLLEIGPTMLRRLAAVCDRAEAGGTDEARLAAYDQLRQMLSWLRLGLDEPPGGDAAS
ncbi:MAG TPA: DUF6027 family protein [Acidimicrobiia bacterium]|jgi:hypothetical protein